MTVSRRSSPERLARTAGVFELLEALTSGFGHVFVPRMIFVPGDAASTAARLLAHALLVRFSVVAALIGVGCHIVWVVLFYELFKPVSRRISRLAASTGLIAIALQAISVVIQASPLVVMESGKTLGAFTPEQISALAYLLLQISARAFNLYLVVFGLWCVLTGVLIMRSTFLPRVLGVLELIAGLCWLSFLWMPFARVISPYSQLLAGIGEMALTFWLIIRGVNASRWEEAARTAASRNFVEHRSRDEG